MKWGSRMWHRHHNPHTHRHHRSHLHLESFEFAFLSKQLFLKTPGGLNRLTARVGGIGGLQERYAMVKQLQTAREVRPLQLYSSLALGLAQSLAGYRLLFLSVVIQAWTLTPPIQYCYVKMTGWQTTPKVHPRVVGCPPRRCFFPSSPRRQPCSSSSSGCWERKFRMSR